MTNPSPLLDQLEPTVPSTARPAVDRPGAATGYQSGASAIEFIAFGPIESGSCQIVATFGQVELEYAGLRRGAGLMDCPQRGTLVARGADRRDLLNRLVTQELKDLTSGTAQTSFLTNRQGRIQSDLLITDLEDRTIIALDAHDAQAVHAALEAFVFTEDVQLTDESDTHHHLWLDGPATAAVLSAAAGSTVDLASLEAVQITIAGTPLVVVRDDRIGDVGCTLIAPTDGVKALFEALSAAEQTRQVGWYAFNTARVEAGTPLFNIDFGCENLPAESGLLEQRVSFTKGCYPGQEIVARMEHLGRPKQTIGGLRIGSQRLPIAGDPVTKAHGEGDPIGVVTSSTLSPMLGAAPVALAMIRTAGAAQGDTVQVAAEGEMVEAELVDRVFWQANRAGPPDEGQTPG
jgi:folate-binding protein YgfZ